jgi:hypothetical protein
MMMMIVDQHQPQLRLLPAIPVPTIKNGGKKNVNGNEFDNGNMDDEDEDGRKGGNKNGYRNVVDDTDNGGMDDDDKVGKKGGTKNGYGNGDDDGEIEDDEEDGQIGGKKSGYDDDDDNIIQPNPIPAPRTNQPTAVPPTDRGSIGPTTIKNEGKKNGNPNIDEVVMMMMMMMIT